jgi:hypothetical protein
MKIIDTSIMKSIILESLEDFRDYREAWEALRQGCGAPIFSSYDLVHLWLDNFREEVKPYIVLIEEGGELIGAAPMCTSHYRIMGLPINTISMVGNLFPLHGYSPLSILAKQDRPEVIGEMIGCVKKGKWNKLVLSYMEPNSPNRRFTDGMVQMGEGKSSSLTPTIHRTYIFPPEGSIAADFEKNTRGNLLRFRSKLEKDGRLEFRRVRTVEDAERAMNLFLSIHDERWQQKDSIFRTDCNRRLAIEMGKLELCSEMGGINELLIDGEVAGQITYFIDGDVARGVHLGMNNKFRSFSPGMLVLMMTMEDNRNRGLKVYDPGHGNEGYKLRMTNVHRELGAAKVYKGTMRALSRIRSLPHMGTLANSFGLQDRHVRRS